MSPSREASALGGVASREAKLERLAGLSPSEVLRATGLSYRQLDWWARTGVLRPSLTQTTGSGTWRGYSESDVATLKAIKRLVDAGVAVEEIRRRGIDMACDELDAALVDARRLLAERDGFA